jgi:hypothetical protein
LIILEAFYDQLVYGEHNHCQQPNADKQNKHPFDPDVLVQGAEKIACGGYGSLR